MFWYLSAFIGVDQMWDLLFEDGEFGWDRCDQFIHDLGGFPLNFILQMTIDFHGDAGIGVPQETGDHDG